MGRVTCVLLGHLLSPSNFYFLYLKLFSLPALSERAPLFLSVFSLQCCCHIRSSGTKGLVTSRQLPTGSTPEAPESPCEADLLPGRLPRLREAGNKHVPSSGSAAESKSLIFTALTVRKDIQQGEWSTKHKNLSKRAGERVALCPFSCAPS